MKIFDRPTNLNGAELKEELAAVGIIVETIRDNANDTISFETTNEAKAAEVVAAHNGTTVAPEPTIADKLASVGLSLDELKSAILGGN
jgi:hypothetical protein